MARNRDAAIPEPASKPLSYRGMLLDDPRELRAAVPPGSAAARASMSAPRRSALALSDTRLVIASPLETIRRRRFRDDVAALFALIDRHGVGGLVIGLPLALAGGDSPRTQSVRQFARNVLALRDMPVAFWDERLSTAAVTREMIAARHDPQTPRRDRRPGRRRLYPAGLPRRDRTPRPMSAIRE